jgi:hypothetical protein
MVAAGVSSMENTAIGAKGGTRFPALPKQARPSRCYSLKAVRDKERACLGMAQAELRALRRRLVRPTRRCLRTRSIGAPQESLSLVKSIRVDLVIPVTSGGTVRISIRGGARVLGTGVGDGI